MKYLRYYFTPLLILFSTSGLLLGGNWMWLGFGVAASSIIFGDVLLGNDYSQRDYSYRVLLEAPLFISLPILTFMLLLLAFSASPYDPLGIFQHAGAALHVDFLARRSHNGALAYLGGVLSCGFLVSGYGTNVGHELIHQVKRPLHYGVGRWLLSMSFNADFAIEHVFNHHVHVGTPRDPATAMRGENAYGFALRSIWRGHLSAWKIELARLRKKQRGALSLHNQMLTGYGMTLVGIIVFGVLAGPLGVLLFTAQGLLARFLLEAVNYMEHYGLQRAPGTPVGPEHSWNSNRVMSGIILYSLVRHSAHHQKASVPFWKLNPYPDAPELPQGYLTTLLFALVPPLWFSIMEPRLAAWDIKHAAPPQAATN